MNIHVICKITDTGVIAIQEDRSIQVLVIKNFCTIKLGLVCKNIALKQKFSLEYIYLLKSRKNKTARVSFPFNRCIKFLFL